jgi:hypothetical protein
MTPRIVRRRGWRVSTLPVSVDLLGWPDAVPVSYRGVAVVYNWFAWAIRLKLISVVGRVPVELACSSRGARPTGTAAREVFC